MDPLSTNSLMSKQERNSKNRMYDDNTNKKRIVENLSQIDREWITNSYKEKRKAAIFL